MKNYEANVEQLELLSVKESNEKRIPAKRVDIVSLRLVKETSLLYKNRAIRSPEDCALQKVHPKSFLAKFVGWIFYLLKK